MNILVYIYWIGYAWAFLLGVCLCIRWTDEAIKNGETDKVAMFIASLIMSAFIGGFSWICVIVMSFVGTKSASCSY